MPKPRTVLTFQCTEAPIDSAQDIGTWWLAETYLTSDGPRMRLLGQRRTYEELVAWRDEVEKRLA